METTRDVLAPCPAARARHGARLLRADQGVESLEEYVGAGGTRTARPEARRRRVAARSSSPVARPRRARPSLREGRAAAGAKWGGPPVVVDNREEGEHAPSGPRCFADGSISCLTACGGRGGVGAERAFV